MSEISSDQKLRELFAKHYSDWVMKGPDLLSYREIGYIPFFGSMIRHKKLANPREMANFVQRIVPRHLYYSSAYYKKPDEKKMQDKEWMGAELIFDLDADHLEGAEKMTYEQILEQIKKHTMRLVNHYLLGDFGFEEKDIKLLFSGGRGYHVHVVNDRVYPLSSDSRREIVQYITASEMNTELFRKNVRTLKSADAGWIRLVDNAVADYYRGQLEKIEASGSSKGKRLISREIAEKDRSIFADYGTAKYALMKEKEMKVLGKILAETVRENRVEIDEPVTTDIHRLIRFPNSLHGKTSLLVKEIPLSEFKDFDPLTEAIPDAFKEGEEWISVENEFKVTLNNEQFHLQVGEHKVPTYVATYAVAAKASKFIQNTNQ